MTTRILSCGSRASEDGDGGQGFEGGDVAGAGHDDIRFAAAIIAGPFPDADARGAMGGGGVHVEPLRGGMFSGDDDVDVMAAAEAVVHDGEEAVGVGREVDADDLGFFVDDVVDESGVLVGEAVVVLPPDVGGEEVVERGDFSAPGEGER